LENRKRTKQNQPPSRKKFWCGKCLRPQSSSLSLSLSLSLSASLICFVTLGRFLEVLISSFNHVMDTWPLRKSSFQSII
jgi:hypothetical protein